MSWDWEKLKEQQQSRGGGIPPQMDEIFNKMKQFKIPGGPLIIGLVILAGLLIYSMVFQIQTNEVGVVQRFGKFNRITYPGLNFKLPQPIEKVRKVKIKYVYKEEFGFRSGHTDRRGSFLAEKENINVSLMLTGDLNVAVVPWIVQYRVEEPYNYLFKVENVQKLLIDMAEATMRQVVGDRSINEVISKRDEIAVEAKQSLQKELDHAETGINVVTIEMKKTNVPEPVQNSFNEVNQAIQEKEKLIYQAKEDYNKAIPKAKGEAERTVKAAEGYSLARVNRAKGDAARFLSLYEEYQKAQDITKRRLYLETMKVLLPKMGPKYFVDSDQKNFLPLLNMGKEDGLSK